MTIDLKRRVIQVQLSRFIVAVILIIIELIFLFVLKFKFGFFTHKFVAIIVAILFLLYKVFEYFLKLNYIYLSTENNRVVLRYFSMSYFSRQKSSIEMPVSQFGGYELYIGMYGYKKTIVLKQKIGNTTASFKPVSISAINKEELEKLKTELNKLSTEK